MPACRRLGGCSTVVDKGQCETLMQIQDAETSPRLRQE